MVDQRVAVEVTRETLEVTACGSTSTQSKETFRLTELASFFLI
jgi:hypothetical protein